MQSARTATRSVTTKLQLLTNPCYRKVAGVFSWLFLTSLCFSDFSRFLRVLGASSHAFEAVLLHALWGSGICLESSKAPVGQGFFCIACTRGRRISQIRHFTVVILNSAEGNLQSASFYILHADVPGLCLARLRRWTNERHAESRQAGIDGRSY